MQGVTVTQDAAAASFAARGGVERQRADRRPGCRRLAAVQQIVALSRSAVTIRHWFEIDLTDLSLIHISEPTRP